MSVTEEQLALLIKRCETDYTPNLMRRTRQYLEELRPSDRNDWNHVDRVMAALTLLYHTATEEHVSKILMTSNQPLKTSEIEETYQFSAQRVSLTLLVMTHSRFIIDGVYRQAGTADLYSDRLMNAIEGSVMNTKAERSKVLEETLAKIRGSD